jgi:hypothetical protein
VAQNRRRRTGAWTTRSTAAIRRQNAIV